MNNWLHFILKITTAQVIDSSITGKSPFQNYSYLKKITLDELLLCFALSAEEWLISKNERFDWSIEFQLTTN